MPVSSTSSFHPIIDVIGVTDRPQKHARKHTKKVTFLHVFNGYIKFFFLFQFTFFISVCVSCVSSAEQALVEAEDVCPLAPERDPAEKT